MSYSLQLVTADASDARAFGIEAVDGEFDTERACIAFVAGICKDISADTWFSDPIDGHGIIYTLSICGRTGKPELFTEYRYRIAYEPDPI